jgi:hypothetical protein
MLLGYDRNGSFAAGAATPTVSATEVYSVNTAVYDYTGSYGTTSTAFTAVPGSTLTLAAGTYLITAQAEIQNDTEIFGSSVALVVGGGVYYGLSEPACYDAFYYTWESWTCTKKVTLAASTSFTVQVSAPSGDATYARNVRIYAIPVQ